MPHRTRALLGFAAFGLYWGALASMRPAGALVDRRGPVVSPVVLGLLATCALLPFVAGSPVALAAALLVIGMVSGAVDVAINAEAAHAEAEGRPAMNLSHAAFSAAVVVLGGRSLWPGSPARRASPRRSPSLPCSRRR